MRREEVKLALRTHEAMMVECKRIGSFAVHPSLDGRGFALSHVGTGRLLEDGFTDAGNAARLAKALEPLNVWNFTDMQAVYDMAPNTRALIRGRCRWFKRDDRMRANATRVTARGGEGSAPGE